MAESDLLDELADLVGSRREATWILEQVSGEEALAIGRRRANGEPLQYLLGTWPFRSIELAVDARALIPRPETEQVVEVALADWRDRRIGADALVLADLGTGSGAIGLSLALELAEESVIEQVLLVDLAPAALELAGENAAGLEVQVELCLGSWHEAIPAGWRGGIHLLVANPPYVAEDEEASLPIELAHEPRAALIASDGDDGTPGFADVAVVIDGALGSLAPGGIVVIEMAEHQVPIALERARAVGLIGLRSFDDLAGHPRGIVGTAP